MSLAVWLATANDGHWHLGIGDPTLLGWITFAAYFAAAFACVRAMRTCRFGAHKLAAVVPDEARNQRALSLMWLGLSVLMVLLGLNKQLDLQTLLTDVARELAKAQGWYGERHVAQVALIAGLAGGVGVAGLAIGFALRKVLRRIVLAVSGLLFIACYVIVRAATFHHVADADVRGSAHPIWLLELAGIALVAFAAHRATVPWENASA